MIEIKRCLDNTCRCGATERGGSEGLKKDRHARCSAGQRAEDRIDEILSLLAVGEAIGGNRGEEVSGGWEFEEELLDELAELERTLAAGLGPDGSGTRMVTEGSARWTEGAGA